MITHIYYCVTTVTGATEKNLINGLYYSKITIHSKKVRNGPLNSSRLLPNGHLGTRGTYDLPSGNQNFKKGAQTGVKDL